LHSSLLQFVWKCFSTLCPLPTVQGVWKKIVWGGTIINKFTKNKTTIGKPPQLHSLAEKQNKAACLSVDHTGYM